MLGKYARQMAEKHELGFPLLLDPGNRLAAEFGLVFTVPEFVRDVYLKLGIDLPRFNGDDSWSLPLPARYIVTADGTIHHAEVNTDYTVRPDPAETVSLLQELQASRQA